MGQAWKARLDNQSPFTLKVAADQGSTYLAPFSSVLVCGKGGPASVNVAVQAQTAAPVSGVTPQLFATWAVSPDDVPPVGAAGGSPTAPFYRFKDEFYWPAVSGENFAPTFAGSGTAYSKYLDRPAYSVPNSGGSLTWPNIPRVSPQGLAVVTFEMWFGQAAAVVPASSQFFYGGSLGASGRPSLGWVIKADGTYQFQTKNAAGALVSLDTGVPVTGSSAGWDHLLMTLGSSSSTMTATNAAGATATVTDSRLIWPVGTNPTDLSPQFWNIGVSNPAAYLSQLKMSYG